MNIKSFLSFCLLLLLIGCTKKVDDHISGNVIFIHPDGVGLSTWNAMRIIYYGPDSDTNWDKLPNIGLYRSHLKNSIGASSNAGATIHAYGVKAHYHSFGMDKNDKQIISASGKDYSIMEEARRAGIKTGIINSGSIIEPGTAVFAASETHRSKYEVITKKVLESGIDVILSGGEDWMIPVGETGFHGNEGKRTDGINLIEEMKSKGYTVVYNSVQLKNISAETEKLLGVFASGHTFNDKPEEEQKKLKLHNFNPEAPTLAEMTSAAIKILSQNNSRFFLVVEEEGTDNFANKNNASGTFEALKRADDAIAVAKKYYKIDPATLVIVASDSEAGGPEVVSYPKSIMPPEANLKNKDKNGAPWDGPDGTGSKPFFSKPDKNGNTFPFTISWATYGDTYGSVVAKAEGLNSELVKGSIDNTEIYKIMYLTLFGREVQ